MPVRRRKIAKLPTIPSSITASAARTVAPSNLLESQILSLLESIYLDFHQIYTAYKASPQTYTFHDPYLAFGRWTLARSLRYRAADETLGREHLAIAMHSPAFFSAMGNECDEIWANLLQKVKDNKNSIRMFAKIRQIPWIIHYDRSPFSLILGMPLLPEAYAQDPYQRLSSNQSYEPTGEVHPHEVYLASTGYIKRCVISGEPIKNIRENVYHKKVFDEYARGAEWPANWQYPRDPTFCAPMANGLWPNCWKCGKSQAPTMGGPGQPSWLSGIVQEVCTCMHQDIFTEPLVEIIEYPALRNDPSPLNRGVRVLSAIKKDDILSEYIGDVVPKQAQDEVGDETYLFDIYGPLLFGNGVDKFEFAEPIAVVTAAWSGNWTRFLNHSEGRDHKVEFVTRVVGYKVRILAVARRDIRFGEELTVSYGDRYFGGLGMEPGANKRAEGVV